LSPHGSFETSTSNEISFASMSNMRYLVSDSIKYTLLPTFCPLEFLVTNPSRRLPELGVVIPYVLSYSAPSSAQLAAHDLPSGQCSATHSLPS
jgi:hypothetical protein